MTQNEKLLFIVWFDTINLKVNVVPKANLGICLKILFL